MCYSLTSCTRWTVQVSKIKFEKVPKVHTSNWETIRIFTAVWDFSPLSHQQLLCLTLVECIHLVKNIQTKVFLVSFGLPSYSETGEDFVVSVVKFCLVINTLYGYYMVLRHTSSSLDSVPQFQWRELLILSACRDVLDSSPALWAQFGWGLWLQCTKQGP